jgi:hypothetical protein
MAVGIQNIASPRFHLRAKQTIFSRSCSNPKYAGYTKEFVNYAMCPFYECFEAEGFGGSDLYLFENMTAAYYSCYCKTYSTMCEKCEEMKDEVPYCQTWLLKYGNLCPELILIQCCGTESSPE